VYQELGDARQEWVDWSISDPAFADQADHIGLAPLSTAGKECQPDAALGGLAPFFAHDLEALVIRGAIRGQGPKPKVDRFIRSERAGQTNRQREP